MIAKTITILLADDDNADCLLFKDALEELPLVAHLTTVHNGEQVMEELTKKGNKLPDVLFLDLNMPLKNGFATLGEIKRSTELQNLPVIIFSTASSQETVKNAFRDAAHYYICKPGDFSQLKKVIYEGLTRVTQKSNPMPLKEDFIITGNSIIIPGDNGSKTV
ncbi:MAG: response regulator [Cyclobacteriaceae bacterium]|nr:response regulator [Cyclobacteriaceae bacterium]